MSVSRKTAVLSVVLAALALPAAAQQPQPPQQQQQPGQPGAMMRPGMMGSGTMMAPGMMQGPGMMMQGPGMMCGMGPGMGPMMGGPGQHIEGRIAFLKTELGITPEQEKLWNAYADALRKTSSSMQAMHDKMISGGMPATLPERMQWHEQMMASRLDALKNLDQAIVPLYKALSPEQQKTADTLIGMM